MVTPCEVAVKSVIPSIRAYIAKELTQTHKMKQDDVADLLGITQTAVSKYIRHVRGQVINLDQTREIQGMISRIASNIAAEKTQGPQLTQKLCEACKAVRSMGLMCELCRRSDPTLDIESCGICKNGQCT